MARSTTANRTAAARPTMSALGYSLLSLLARKERSGYELSRFTSGPRSMIFASSGHSNIYKELAKLAADGCVAFRVVKDARPFDKKLYRLTPRGLAVLRTWLRGGPGAFVSRRELNVRMHAMWLLPQREAVALLDRTIALAEAEIRALRAHADYLQAENRLRFPPPPRHPLFGTACNIALEIDSRRLIVAWCRRIKRQWQRAGRGRATAAHQRRLER